MEIEDLEPIVRKLVLEVRRCQDALGRALDQLEGASVDALSEAYLERQVGRAKRYCDKASWTIRELPFGDSLMSATAVMVSAGADGS